MTIENDNKYGIVPEYCAVCGTERPYKIYVGCACYEKDGTTYVYNDYVATCAVCGKPMSVEWINRHNEEIREKAVLSAGAKHLRYATERCT